jgi:hypothetical protein
MKIILQYLFALFPLCCAQCQPSKKKIDEAQQKQLNDCKQYDYCFKDSLMFYKGRQFELYGNIEDYIKVFGKYDRIVEDKFKGGQATYYIFKDNKIGIMGTESPKIMMTHLYVNKKGETVSDDFKNIQEAIKKYGMYDSTRVEKSLPRSERHYVWDKAGLSAWSTNDTIHSLILRFVKGISFENNVLNTKEENKRIHDMEIWTPYSGRIYFTGNVVNVGMLNADSWNMAIAKLDLTSEKYDPPGDSKTASRVVHKYYKGKILSFTIQRTLPDENEKDRIELISIDYINDY